MAASVKRLTFQARHCARRFTAQPPTPTLPLSRRRPFTSSGARLRKKDDDDDGDDKPITVRKGRQDEDDFSITDADLDALFPLDPANLDADDRRIYDFEMTPEDRERWPSIAEASKAHFTRPAAKADLARQADQALRELDEEFPPMMERPERLKQGFWSMGEETDDPGEDDEFMQDDISSLGHRELEKHRELREYARLAAWEMPLLSKLARPFEPPTKAQPLRYRYTTYLGDNHPASRKVVVEFCPTDLPDLTPAQQVTLTKLCGPRYNPETEIVKMSCESFDTPAQNKRYLSDLVSNLIKEASTGKDTFEDIPLDTRHAKPRKWVDFPKEWIMTKERREALSAMREERKALEQQKIEQAQLVDGVQAINAAMAARMAAPEPVMAQVPAGRRGRERPQRRMA